jgi:hypothetical protein
MSDVKGLDTTIYLASPALSRRQQQRIIIRRMRQMVSVVAPISILKMRGLKQHRHR